MTLKINDKSNEPNSKKEQRKESKEKETINKPQKKG